MLVRFPDNPLRVALNIVRLNAGVVCALLALQALALLVNRFVLGGRVSLDYRPVGVLGAGVAIIIGFRNNSAYDRWWEARKIWGGLVNASRSFSMKVLTLVRAGDAAEVSALHRRVLLRQLGWLHALRLQLREQSEWNELAPWLAQAEMERLPAATNKASQLSLAQARDLALARERGWVDAHGHVELLRSIEDLTALQGQAERIKSTVFPLYYGMYTRLFLWLFVLLLPAAVVREMGLATIPVCAAVSFVFVMLERTARVTENPFANQASDTPMSALCRVVEIDVRQFLGDAEVPPKLPPSRNDVLGTEFLM
jgi:putative membrane protein